MTILLKGFLFLTLHYRVLEKGKGGRKSIRKRWEKRAPRKRWGKRAPRKRWEKRAPRKRRGKRAPRKRWRKGPLERDGGKGLL
jgi:hypothetical protein